MSDRLSFVDLLIFSAPKGESPYAYAANYVAHIMPDKPDWYYKQIIASGVLNACNLILTLTSFVVVKRRRQASGDLGSLWFFRTRYGHPSHVPYIMPNPLTMFLVWNTMFTLLMQPYTWLNYFAYKYPSRAVTSKMYFWYGFVFTFDGAGMWMSAFGTLYATLLPRVLLGQEQKIPFLLHPVLLNSLCFSLPVLLYVVQITTSTLSQIAWSKLINLQFDLVETLSELSGEWLASNGTTVNTTLRQVVSVDGNRFMSAATGSKAAFVRNAWATAAWYFLCTILFTPTAIWLLLTLRRAAAQLSRKSLTPAVRSPIFPGGNEISSSQQRLTAPGHLEASPPTGQNRGTGSQLRRLRQAYVTAALQFIATLLCLITAVGSFVWVAVDVDDVVNDPVLHAIAILLSDWVFAAVGTTVNILIIIRMTSRIEPDSSHPTPENSQGHARARSASMGVITRDEKPIPLHVIPGNTYPSETELKDTPSSAGHYTLESEQYDRNNRF